jgi:SPP1 family predicted phage head-tail adaptor
MIGEMRHLVNILEYSYITDIYGGSSPVLSNSTNAWAKVEWRNGGNSIISGQKVWNYDYKITVRYDSNITSDNTVVYDGQELAIVSIETKSEAQKRFMILRCNKVEQDIGGIVINGAVYRVDGFGDGSTNVVFTQLIGKRLLTVHYDGIGFGSIITVGTPTAKQVLFNSATGTLTTAMPIEPDQTVYVLWQ